ncbi:zinc finger MYM-type protein 1-like protein, partial [Tanacetum coccineum]
ECFSEEVLDVIITEIEDDVFSLLVDESSDVSKKEQMALVLLYVDRLGIVKERFAGAVHVDDTSSKTLEAGYVTTLKIR